MLSLVSPLSFFPLRPLNANRQSQRKNNQIHGNAKNACQPTTSGIRFRKYHICFNTLPAATVLGK
jgi:hypothetical protein